MLVKGRSEVCIEEISIVQCLSSYPTNELEVIEVSFVEIRGGGGVVGVAC